MELLPLMSLNFLLLFSGYITSSAPSQVYYKTLGANINIEETALERLEAILAKLTNVQSGDEKINSINVSKDCYKEQKVDKCDCREGFKGDGAKPIEGCIPRNRVSVKGTVVLNTYKYESNYGNPNSNEFTTLSQNLTEEFSKYYSKLKWFHSLTILGFSKGSVIVNFTMTFDDNKGLENISNVTKNLQDHLKGKAELVTEGFVKITAPNSTVKTDERQELICQTSRYIGKALWFLQIEGKKIQIHNGTEANLFSDDVKSSIELTKPSYIWKGEYTCEFKDNLVSHQAHAILDVALLPDVQIYSKPQFPNCKKDKIPRIDVTCVIKNLNETYEVKWQGSEFDSTEHNDGNVVYKSQTTIHCDSTTPKRVSCTFKNRLNQIVTKILDIPVIDKNSTTCEKDGEWPVAKADHNASLFCPDKQRGLRTRECDAYGSWRTEISDCVNVDLDEVAGQAKNLERGLGDFKEVTPRLFEDMKQSTQKNINNTANIETSVSIFQTLYTVSINKSESLNETALPDFLTSASNIINASLKGSWSSDTVNNYLISVNGLLQGQSNEIKDLDKNAPNIKLNNCSQPSCGTKVFNVSMQVDSGSASAVGFRTLGEHMPTTIGNESKELEIRGIVLQVNSEVAKTVTLTFNNVSRKPNHRLYCVVWLPEHKAWSSKGCEWSGQDKEGECNCELHSSSSVRSSRRYNGGAFTVLMSKDPEPLPFMNYLTYIGLGVSIASLVLCLLIEFVVWNSVVKSSISHFRHTAVVNISLCLLLADSSFMATAFPPPGISNWCQCLVVVKHYCFLAMFFWMLCLSLVLLHSLIFVFQRLRKKIYLGTSFFVGYICPLLIVVLTVIAYDNGAKDSYYNPDTCWLKYEAEFQGSFFAFVMPVGIIIIINVFSMMVVIVRLLKPSVSEGSTQDDKEVIKSILKAVIFLTPIFGVTWIFGFFVLITDHTTKPLSVIVNYTFTVCNAFQGLFILLTACLGENKVRETLCAKFRPSSKVSITSKVELSTSKTSNDSTRLNKAQQDSIKK